MKKFIPVLLSVFVVLAASATAFAATVYTEGALNYTIEDGSISITNYFGKDASVTVPASIAGTPVNTIAKGAFANNDNVKTVNLPDTITTVEEGAFAAGITVNYNSNVNGGGTAVDGGESGSTSSGVVGGGGSTDADNVNSNGSGSAEGSGGVANSGIDEGTAYVDDALGSGDAQVDGASSNASAANKNASEQVTAADQAVASQQDTGAPWIWVVLGVAAVVAVGVAVALGWKKSRRGSEAQNKGW